MESTAFVQEFLYRLMISIRRRGDCANTYSTYYGMNLRKKLLKTFIWSVMLYGIEPWTMKNGKAREKSRSPMCGATVDCRQWEKK